MRPLDVFVLIVLFLSVLADIGLWVFDVLRTRNKSDEIKRFRQLLKKYEAIAANYPNDQRRLTVLELQNADLQKEVIRKLNRAEKQQERAQRAQLKAETIEEQETNNELPVLRRAGGFFGTNERD